MSEQQIKKKSTVWGGAFCAVIGAAMVALATVKLVAVAKEGSSTNEAQ